MYHPLLTPMSFQTCITDLLLWNPQKKSMGSNVVVFLEPIDFQCMHKQNTKTFTRIFSFVFLGEQSFYILHIIEQLNKIVRAAHPPFPWHQFSFLSHVLFSLKAHSS